MHVVFDAKQQSRTKQRVVFTLDPNLTATAATAGEHWLAAPYFGGQIIEIGCRCEFAPNRNCIA